VTPWHPHPDVWAVVAALGGGYWWALTRWGPGASRRQVVLFGLGLLALLLHSEWPVHEIAERYLFSVHMVQHIGYQLIAAPLLLLGLPGWLLRRLVVEPRWAYAIVRRLTRPLIAGLLFNLVVAVTHWPMVVNTSVENHLFHFGVHVVIFGSAVVMWLPVLNLGRAPELPSLSEPGRMVYLFLQSVLPTVPASFLTFGENVLYRVYEQAPRLAGLSAIDDQQLAGALMKVYAGGLLWATITVIFFRWHAREEEGVLRWDDVERELARTSAPSSPR
jgi:putative membrane protein